MATYISIGTMSIEKFWKIRNENKKILVEAYEADIKQYSELLQIKDDLFMPYNCLVSSCSGIGRLYIPDGQLTKASMLEHKHAKNVIVYLPTLHIDTILSKHDKICKLDMNCEGSEIQILMYADINLLKRVRIMYVEFHSFREHDIGTSEEDVTRVIERLATHFTPECINEKHPVYRFTRRNCGL